MARGFAPIPNVNYSGEPGGRVEKTELPSISGVEAPFKDAADIVEGAADRQFESMQKQQETLEKQQQQTQAILDKKQAIVDNVDAVTAAGKYQDRASTVLAQYKQQQAGDPLNGKAKAQLFNDLQQAAKDTVGDPNINGAVSLQLMKHTATINNRLLANYDDWGQRRATQLTKSKVSDLEDVYAKGVSTVYSPQALAATMKDAHATLDGLYNQVSANPAKDKKALDAKMATNWAELQSETPHGAFAVLAALGDQKGILQRTLDPKTLTALTKKAQMSFEGGGVTAQLNALATAHKDISDVLGLASSNDPGYMQASLAKRVKLDEDMEATRQDQTIPAAARQGRLSTLETSREILDVVDSMYRSHPGVFKQKVDPKVSGDLLARSKAPWMKHDDGIGDHLQDLLELRRDAAQAHQAGTLGTQTYEAIETRLQLALPKSQAAQDTGKFKHIGDQAKFDWRSPLQAGNGRLDDLLDEKGPYGHFSQEQKNEAWTSFYQKLNDVQKGKGPATPLTRESAQTMADEAAAYAHGLEAGQ